MKLLVVTSSYPRFAGDIAGRFVLEWVEHLGELGHQVKVLTWYDSSAAGEPLDVGHEVVRIPYAPPGADTLFYGAGTPENLRENRLRALLAAPAAVVMAGRIAHEIKHFRPDVLVGHWLVPAGLLVRAAGKLSAVPSLVVGHSGGVHLLERLPGPVGRALAGFVCSGPTTVPSLPLADKLGRLAPAGHSAHVLPMGFEPLNRSDAVPEAVAKVSERRRPWRRKGARNAPRRHGGRRSEEAATSYDSLTEAVAPRDWLCMGRLVDIKGVDLAIEAFARADLPETTALHIAGDGPKRLELENLADALGANVTFHGFVTGEDRERLWERCGYALFTSREIDGRHEGLPVSFLEVCSRGIVPLCAPIPGMGAYLADRELQEVPTRSVEEWARRIEQLAAMPDEELEGLAETQRAKVAELEWPRLIRRWESLLEQASLASFQT